MSLLRHYYICQNCVIMSPLLRIITLFVSIIMSLLLIIMIITYYYVFETGQRAEVKSAEKKDKGVTSINS